MSHALSVPKPDRLAPATPSLLPAYATKVLNDLSARGGWEREFLLAVEDVLLSISPLLRDAPHYQGGRILERMVEPDRIFAFRVTWTDDNNNVQVNRGWRVQFNGALGPYKGGTRFHASVNLDTLKALAFEQTFKNALTGLPLGSGKGGADFPVSGRSEHEIMRFSQSYMTELFHHIGPDIDVPAGDVGVGTREVGFMFGQYRRLTRSFGSALTGKGLGWGGSRLRPEATGYGVAYFAEEMLRARGESLEGKTVAVSGFGNVAWGAVKKVTELGGKVVTLSGPDGFVHDPDGVRDDKLDFMLGMRLNGRDEVRAYAERYGLQFVSGQRPWSVPCDLALPCAIQNELDEADARALANNGCRFVVEGANMPSTRAALQVFRQAGVVFAPGKAANAGGVAVSGLEMTQNRSGQSWDTQQVDAALHRIMANIHRLCSEAAERHGHPGDYVVGANIGAFAKVADAMLDQGVI